MNNIHNVDLLEEFIRRGRCTGRTETLVRGVAAFGGRAVVVCANGLERKELTGRLRNAGADAEVVVLDDPQLGDHLMGLDTCPLLFDTDAVLALLAELRATQERAYRAERELDSARRTMGRLAGSF
jgi:hypothetical protein